MVVIIGFCGFGVAGWWLGQVVGGLGGSGVVGHGFPASVEDGWWLLLSSEGGCSGALTDACPLGSRFLFVSNAAVSAGTAVGRLSGTPVLLLQI